MLEHLLKTEPWLGLRDVYVDEPAERQANSLISDIFDRIERANLVIADLTDLRPAVVYELALIHALGTPVICVNNDKTSMLYVQSDHHIDKFEMPDGYDRFDEARSGHRALCGRLREFLTLEPDDLLGEKFVKFTGNPISTFFDGLPIVDISAPAGLAAGYWDNTVKRFFARGGYMAGLQPVAWNGEPSPANRDTPLSIEQFIVLRPPSLTNGVRIAPGETSADADLRVLVKELSEAGYCLFDGTLTIDSKRTFSAKFLGRSGEVIYPAIVIDIPTTLYALEKARRLLRLVPNSTKPDAIDAVQKLRQRRLREMLRRFELLIEDYITRDGTVPREYFRFVSVEEVISEINGLRKAQP